MILGLQLARSKGVTKVLHKSSKKLILFQNYSLNNDLLNNFFKINTKRVNWF